VKGAVAADPDTRDIVVATLGFAGRQRIVFVARNVGKVGGYEDSTAVLATTAASVPAAASMGLVAMNGEGQNQSESHKDHHHL
jgi:hypothetical protein